MTGGRSCTNRLYVRQDGNRKWWEGLPAVAQHLSPPADNRHSDNDPKVMYTQQDKLDARSLQLFPETSQTARHSSDQTARVVRPDSIG